MSPVHEPALKQLGGSPIRRKRKLVSSGGQKWFKGSPRKKERPSSTPGGGHQLKQSVGGGGNNSLELISPTHANPTLPPMLVQFILHGGAELRLSVYDQIPLTSRPDEDIDSSSKKKKKCKEEGQDQQISDLPSIVQQSDEHRSLPQPNYHLLEEYKLSEAPPLPNAYIRWMDDVELGEEVEYHVDEEDSAWLDLINSGRDGVGITLEVMELLMDRLEKESYLQMQSSGLDQRPVIDDDAVCCICMDGECQNSNAILFCDMCNLAVHQECYGVPYIPEGQWLCRRCLQSPSREVECVLCPNKGGAFKQTDDGRWAHVVCAIWIPEVCFANTVFLEPVDSVNNIPPARWRLCCFICKYKGRGACIQCHKSNCYTAFHVTCAQHAGLCMRMDTVRIGSTVTVRKTAYCDNHAPPDFIRQTREGDSSPTVRQKLKACRKMLAEKRSAKPTLSIPTIPPERVTEISSSVSFARKNVFIKRLLSYWKLKRIQRNGVPLLRRLQAASNHPPSSGHHRAQLIHDPSIGAPSQSDHAWKFLMRLRQDLERARLLCELIRKREKQKRELVALKTEEWSFKTTPFVQFLLSVLDEIGGRDPQNIFAEPVDAEAVPDYHTVIHSPMDLSTMRQRAQQLHYDSLNEMKKDFQLMINNCLLYNSKETIFHRTGLRLQESGSMIFREAEKVQDQIGYDPDSGLHLDKAPTLSISSNSATPASTTRRSDDHIFEEMDAFMRDEDRLQLPHDVHVAKLQDIADKVVTVQHTGARKKRYERLYREIQRVRRLENPSPKSPRSPKRELHPSSPISRQSVSPTPTLRKLRRKSVIDQTDEHENKEDEADEAIKERPPKRRVVQQMEAKSTASVTQTRRMSRTLDSSPATHPVVVAATPIRNHHAPAAAAAPTTPLRRTTRLSVDGEQQHRVTRTQLGTPTSTTSTTPTKASPLVNGIMRNGTRNNNNNHNNNNSNKKTKSTKKSREVDSHPVLAAALIQQQPRLPVPVDSFSVYREEKRDSSDGEEQDEKEDEQEDEDDQTDDDSSSEGDDSSSEDEVSDESSDAAATNHHHMHRVLTRGGGKANSTDLSSNRASRTRRPRRRRDSSSSSSSASSSHSSRSSSSDGQVVEETQKAVRHPLISPEHMQLVWAYAHEAWSPALIVNPDNVGLSPSPDKNGVTIPVPPVDVLNRRPPAGRKRAGKEFHLVLFFDKSSTWEWVTRKELEPLGVTPAVDRRHLMESQNPKKQRRAFDKAILHKASIKAGQASAASNTIQPPPLDLE